MRPPCSITPSVSTSETKPAICLGGKLTTQITWRPTSSAYVTMVALDRDGKPMTVPPVIPETEEEQRRYREAETRRRYRLEQRARQS